MARSDILPVREIEYRCDKCKRVDSKPTYFYRSNSTLYDNNGYLPICKDCLAQLYNRYLLSFHDIHKAIKRICMAFDLYYSDSIVDSCLKGSKASTPSIGDYMRKLNISQYKGKTFDNTIDEGFIFDINDDVMIPSDEEVKPITTIPDSVRMRWGSGLSDDDYKTLEEHYKYLKKANPDFDSNQEIFIMDLCQIKMQQTRAMRAGRTDDYIKLTESYRKTFSQAGLKTTPDVAESNNESWGTWIGMISKYTPEEYYKDKTLYKDFDGIGDYFKRFVLRPLRNLQLGTTDRDKEFFVSDEEE